MRPGPIRHRAEFATLRMRGVRSRHRPVRVTFVPGGEGARVAFAISRRCGTAVRRNRIRRRLRAVLADLTLPSGAYLLVVSQEALALDTQQLRAVVLAALSDVGVP